MLMQCFIDVKVYFEKAIGLLFEKCPFPLVLARTTIMLQHLIVQFSNYFAVVAQRKLKTKENFKLSALKVVAVAYDRWSLTRGSNW